MHACIQNGDIHMQGRFDPRKKFPNFLVTQYVDNDIIHTKTKKIATLDIHDSITVDETPVKLSHIFRTHNYHANYVDGIRQQTKPKAAMDKIVIGDTKQGLPFEIIARSYPNHNPQHMFEFIDKHVVLLTRQYADRLASSESYQDVIHELNLKINELKLKHPNKIEFSIAIGINFEYKNEKYFAGYNHGETGFAFRQNEDVLTKIQNDEVEYKKKKEKNEIINIKPPLSLSSEDYDFISLATHTPLDKKSINVFIHKVEPTNKIYGYTNLDAQLLNSINKNELKFSLHDKPLQEKTQALFQYHCLTAETNRETREIGDVFTASYIIIPTEQIQKIKRSNIEIQENFEYQKKVLLKHLEKFDSESEICLISHKILETAEKNSKKRNANISGLTKDLIACNAVFTNNNNDNIQKLYKRADLAKGRPSEGDRALGILLMTLASIAALITLPLAPTGIGIATSIGCALVFMAGHGFFHHGGRKKQSKNLYDLAEVAGNIKMRL